MGADTVSAIGNSLVQFGHHNERIYVMRMASDDIPDIIRSLDDLARKERYSKIVVKIPISSVPVFLEAGYIIESIVPHFFHGKEAAAFMAWYSDPKRKEVANHAVIRQVLSTALGYKGREFSPQLPAGFSLTAAHPDDAGEIAALYRSVFATYPFPITDLGYVVRSMREGIRYFCIRSADRIVAVSSCEIHTDAQNAEMTDFATDTTFRGKWFAGNLLHVMESATREEGVRLAYTIARATSEPVNILFARAGYEYAGLLPNNTNIGGKIESMNVWYKSLATGNRCG